MDARQIKKGKFAMEGKKSGVAYADLVFFNGFVITVDGQDSISEAVGIIGNTIYRVGTNDEMQALIGPYTRTVDLGGKALLPGFIDAHSHMIFYGQFLEQIDCSYPSVASVGDILSKVRQQASQTPKGEWIQGWGYDEYNLKEQRAPSRQELDEAAPNHPVVLKRTCIHAFMVNSVALEQAGINRGTEDPTGGRIVRDPKSHEPTGLLLEIPAMFLIESNIPRPGVSELRKAIKKGSGAYVREGITSTHDAGVGSINPADIHAYLDAYNYDHIPVRVYLMVRDYTYQNLGFNHGGLGLYTGFGNSHLRLGPVKWIIDGGIGAKSAAMKNPYEGEKEIKGFLSVSPQDLLKGIREAHNNKFQVSIHAIGDHAITIALDCFETVLTETPRSDHRHRIEHFTCADPNNIERARSLGIQPIVQPTMIYRLGDSFSKNLGDRIKHVKPLRSLIAAGLRPAGSSDRPVVPGNPFLGIYAAVTRKTQTGHILTETERISVMDAIKMYTINAAYSSFEENLKGSIEAGKVADLIVLSDNPLTIETEALKDIKVTSTVVDGKFVYNV